MMPVCGERVLVERICGVPVDDPRCLGNLLHDILWIEPPRSHYGALFT